MDDASPATFRPTWRQALGRGVWLGALGAVAGLVAVALTTLVLLAVDGGAAPPAAVWLAVAFGPPVLGVPAGLLAGRCTGAEVSPGGIRWAPSGGAAWTEVVDLRAERRRGRIVVSIYLDSGGSVQLPAPYSGGWFAADPRFEGKMVALSGLWRSHRFGGLPG